MGTVRKVVPMCLALKFAMGGGKGDKSAPNRNGIPIYESYKKTAKTRMIVPSDRLNGN